MQEHKERKARKDKNKMSKFFSLCRANHKKHGLKDQPIEFKNSLPTGLKRGLKSRNVCFYTSIFLIVMILGGAFFYIFNITSTATNGFKVSEYNTKIDDLKLVNQNLREKINSFENLDYIKSKAGGLGLVSVNEVEYLKVGGSGVALK